MLVSGTWRIAVDSPESCREQDRPSSPPPSGSIFDDCGKVPLSCRTMGTLNRFLQPLSRWTMLRYERRVQESIIATGFPGAKELWNKRSSARLKVAAGRHEHKLARPEAYSQANVFERDQR